MRGMHPLRLRHPRAIPSRPNGVSIANMIPLRDDCREPVVAATEIVSVAVTGAAPFRMTVALAGLHVTYATGLVHVSATEPANPPSGVIVRVTVPDAPGAIEMVLGVAVMVAAAGVTANVCAALTDAV